jgi:hypothetical protein
MHYKWREVQDSIVLLAQTPSYGIFAAKPLRGNGTRVLFKRFTNTKRQSETAFLYWWTLQDSNLPPPRCKRGALPDELRAHERVKHKHARMDAFDEQLGAQAKPAGGPCAFLATKLPYQKHAP